MKAARWHTCNVLDARQDRRELWQCGRDSAGAKIESERVVLSTDPLPAEQVRRTLRDLWQPRLNVAWLPSDQVFLRVIELPPGEPQELPGMVELQLERLSPLPVAQVVWTFEPLPVPAGEPQTVIVAIAARTVVEEFLGNLEGAGYLADRLELPQIQELLATQVGGEGVWIFPREEGTRAVCLVAWWQGGRLRNLNLMLLPAEGPGAHLVEQLKQVAWAGEMEGWLEGEPEWHLVASEELGAELETALREMAPARLVRETPLALAKLATLSAASRARANLVPPERAVRYRQEFIDRLWMRALGMLGLVYLLGVLGYFAALQVLGYQKDRVEQQAGFAAGAYTNALQLRDKVQILQEQVNLKFAALDCLKAAAEALPVELTLNQLTFTRGKKLGLFGTVPADQQSKVYSYNEALTKASVNGQPLFSQVVPKNIQGSAAANQPLNWSVECEIRRSDLP
jgi:hypothetical protein